MVRNISDHPSALSKKLRDIFDVQPPLRGGTISPAATRESPGWMNQHDDVEREVIACPDDQENLDRNDADYRGAFGSREAMIKPAMAATISLSEFSTLSP